MTKLEFLEGLKNRLNCFNENEIENWLNYYSEIIDDMVEDGMGEEEAVNSLGDMDSIIDEILKQTSISKLAKAKLKRKSLSRLEITLLVVGFPLWFSLLVVAVAVVFSLYVSLWAIIISLWACFGAVIAGGVGALASGIVIICVSDTLQGIALTGAALALTGLGIYLFYGCKWASCGIIWLTKKLVLGIKKCFIKKEAA